MSKRICDFEQNPADAPSRRFRRVAFFTLLVLFCGLLYAAFIFVFGRGIPCVFQMMTGLKCPSCGVTGMCLAILRLDFKTAFYCNPAIFCMLPLGAAVAARHAYIYVRSGRTQPDRLTAAAMILMIAVLIVYGILRNIL